MTDWRKPLPPGEVVGYEYRSAEHNIVMFVCAYHFRREEEHVNWKPITAADTHQEYYQCDRWGCELSWHDWPLAEQEATT